MLEDNSMVPIQTNKGTCVRTKEWECLEEKLSSSQSTTRRPQVDQGILTSWGVVVCQDQWGYSQRPLRHSSNAQRQPK
jgi:hypothetical protein